MSTLSLMPGGALGHALYHPGGPTQMGVGNYLFPGIIFHMHWWVMWRVGGIGKVVPSRRGQSLRGRCKQFTANIWLSWDRGTGPEGDLK